VISPNDRRCCGPKLQWAHVTSMVAPHCYQIVTVAMGKDVMSPKPVSIEGHNSDGWFGDITDEAL
jgi:hypothetical protein